MSGRGFWLVGLALVLPHAGARAETCRYAGETSQSGHVAVETRAAVQGDAVTLDVRLDFTLQTWLFDARYLRQEISNWRGGALQSLAVNARDSVGGHVVRQQWDVFERAAGGLQARRVQGKTLAEFRQRHGGFAVHWPEAAFGQPWLPDYAGANPERRPDLDLPAVPAGLRTPLALAFYWSRWLPSEGGNVSVFLPGFKRDARADLGFGAAVPGEGGKLWQGTVSHPALSAAPPSLVQAWVAPDHRLLRLAFDGHAPAGSASGSVRALGCSE